MQVQRHGLGMISHWCGTSDVLAIWNCTSQYDYCGGLGMRLHRLHQFSLPTDAPDTAMSEVNEILNITLTGEQAEL